VHDEARAAVARIADAHDLRARTDVAVLDLGGRNINGSLRDLFATRDWTAVDAVDAEGVDIVADARTWTPDRAYDVVLCTEVFEHVRDWRRVLGTCARALTPGGTLIATCASDRRPRHGMSGGPWPEPGEHYANVPPAELAAHLAHLGFLRFAVEYQFPPGDLYCWAKKP
jgi:SAM-dependent methyltransferase